MTPIDRDIPDRLRASVRQIGESLDLLEGWRAELLTDLQENVDDLVRAAQSQDRSGERDDFRPVDLVAEHFIQTITAKRDDLTQLVVDLEAEWRELDRLELDVVFGR